MGEVYVKHFCSTPEKGGDWPQSTFTSTILAPESFIGQKRATVRKTTLHYQLEALKRTGRYDCFKLEWKDIYNEPPDPWPIPKWLFWDSDVAKWIEGACYFLREQDENGGTIDHSLSGIRDAVDDIVEMIRGAQQDDGYINVHFTLVDPKGRFSNLRDLHELYNAGHLIEAAVAHHQAFGTDRLLDPILKYVDLLHRTFGPAEGQKHGYPGHPEIEIALLRLHSITGDHKHFNLAKYFITERGSKAGQDGQHYYDFEAKDRGELPGQRPTCYPEPRSYWYQQAHIPILEQNKVDGHSVRAMYLFTGTAAMLLQEPSAATSTLYKNKLNELWCNMVSKKMYLTGGIGSMGQWEGFGPDYFLPQGWDEGGGYAETCAGIGVMMWAERMLQLDLDRKYGDVMELAFYNAVLGGMSCDGKRFSYANQLATCDDGLSNRSDWFSCACCPPNVTRLLGFIGGYIWSAHKPVESKTINFKVHLFNAGVLSYRLSNGELAQLEMATEYPLGGDVNFKLTLPHGFKANVAIRIPHWSAEFSLVDANGINMTDVFALKSGYIHLPHHNTQCPAEFTLHLNMHVRQISPHPLSNQDTVTYARGPLIYCVEDVDNSWVHNHFKTVLFAPNSAQETLTTDPFTGETYVKITDTQCWRHLDTSSCDAQPGMEGRDGNVIMKSPSSMPSAEQGPTNDLGDLAFIPFYFRANRNGRGQMRVGLRRLRH